MAYQLCATRECRCKLPIPADVSVGCLYRHRDYPSRPDFRVLLGMQWRQRVSLALRTNVGIGWGYAHVSAPAQARSPFRSTLELRTSGSGTKFGPDPDLPTELAGRVFSWRTSAAFQWRALKEPVIKALQRDRTSLTFAVYHAVDRVLGEAMLSELHRQPQTSAFPFNDTQRSRTGDHAGLASEHVFLMFQAAACRNSKQSRTRWIISRTEVAPSCRDSAYDGSPHSRAVECHVVAVHVPCC
jgi:hypothetical protein